MSILRNMEPLNVNRMGKEIEQIERHYLNFDFFSFVCAYLRISISSKVVICCCRVYVTFCYYRKIPSPFSNYFAIASMFNARYTVELQWLEHL